MTARPCSRAAEGARLDRADDRRTAEQDPGGRAHQPVAGRDPELPGGWERVSARASSVVRYLIERYHVPETRLSAAGYADTWPLYPASDPGRSP